MTVPDVLIIGGTAAYYLDVGDHARLKREMVVETPYGPSEVISLLEFRGHALAFLSRHGRGQLERGPHAVRYRANLWAARELGVRAVLAWNSVGSLWPHLTPGRYLILSDLIGWLDSGPPETEWAGNRITSPFDGELRRHLRQAAERFGLRTQEAVYASTDGPHLESPAEIAFLRRCGAAVVGMTVGREVLPALEFKIPYAAMAVVTNFATGVAPAHGGSRPVDAYGPQLAQRIFPVVLLAASLYLEEWI